MTTFDTPILFLVFNRLDTTKRVFERIRDVKPRKLFIASDGPRASVLDEKYLVDEIRIYLDENIDWPCNVSRLYRDENLGCRKSVSSAITWFFENVEQGIIIEDDCLPDISFFSFCEELLEEYRDNEEIMCISGNNFQRERSLPDYSYYFSIYNHCWGWASWRRAWKHYYHDLTQLQRIDSHVLISGMMKDRSFIKYWELIFEKMLDSKIDTWDYIWTFSCWSKKGLSVLPNVNLVENIGFDKRATHTKKKNVYLPVACSMLFPMKHPNKIVVNRNADRYTNRMHFSIFPESCFFYIKSRILKLFQK